MLKRGVFGVVFVTVVVLGLLTPYTAILLAIIIFTGCVVELQRFMRFAKVKTSLTAMILLNLFLYLLGLAYIADFIEAKYLSLLLLLGYAPFVIELYRKHQPKPMFAVGLYLLSYFYITIPFLMLTSLSYNVLEPFTYRFEIVLIILGAIWMNDVGAYLVGSSFGKRKLFERISPKKSVEGFMGGFVLTLLLGAVYYHYGLCGLKLVDYLVLTAIISISSVVGDLVESMFKRAIKIKDSGKVIPGHGGFMDRFDAMIFSVPFVYIYMILFC